MKATGRFLLLLAAWVLSGPGAPAQTPAAPDSELKCSGTVTDADGHPLSGATVEYWRFGNEERVTTSLEIVKQTLTETNGAFEFQAPRSTGVLLARKTGFAPAWIRLSQSASSKPETIELLALSAPAVLAGVVVDDAGKPVANAEVSVAFASLENPDEEAYQRNFIGGKPARDIFSTRTDAAGHFSIDNFPANATAALDVRTLGKALRQHDEEIAGASALPYHAGQSGIKLVVEPGGTIEGKIITEGTNPPPLPARLSLVTYQGAAAYGTPDPVQSGADGSFRFADVPEGSYQIKATFGTNPLPDWVAADVQVSVDSGATTNGLQLTATHGGLLEVSVHNEEDDKPVAHVLVNASKDDSGTTALSDANGVARFRLPPGVYQVTANRGSVRGYQTPASTTVEAGATNTLDVEVPTPVKITGIVHRPDGKPAPGLRVVLAGFYVGDDSNVKTDAGGKFSVDWVPRAFGQNAPTTCVLVRDTEHNLAVAQEVDPDTGPLDLKLAPGLTLVARAQCDGKPITNATARLLFKTSNNSTSSLGFARTNSQGQFEISALPPGRQYGLTVTAPGYGQSSLSDATDSAEAVRVEIDPIELRPANLKLAGRVLDSADKPVADVFVNLSGEDQPPSSTRTDRKGHFHFDHICDGTVRLFANFRNSYGQASAKAGDTDIVLRFNRANMMAGAGKSSKLEGTVSDPDGKPVAGARLGVLLNFNGTRWTRTATNGHFGITWFLQPWQIQMGTRPRLLVRDTNHNLAGLELLQFNATNLDIKLKPAMTLTGIVKHEDGSPVVGASVGVSISAENNSAPLDAKEPVTDAKGRYEIKCLPSDAAYTVNVSAPGHGKGSTGVPPDRETNRVEMPDVVLKLANHPLAGRVLNEKGKPAAGVNVSMNGDGQPDGYVTTDSKGRFHFKVCDGQIRLYANAQNAFVNDLFQAGDTNIELKLSAQPQALNQTPRRVSLKGSPLPDLAILNLAAAPTNHAVLLCLFDAGQRASRQLMHQLIEQAGALRQRGVTVLGAQAVVTGGAILNDWKGSNPVYFPIGRLTDDSSKSKWIHDVPELPWLILTDASHRVVAEGFALDDLDDQLKQLAK